MNRHLSSFLRNRRASPLALVVMWRLRNIPHPFSAFPPAVFPQKLSVNNAHHKAPFSLAVTVTGRVLSQYKPVFHLWCCLYPLIPSLHSNEKKVNFISLEENSAVCVKESGTSPQTWCTAVGAPGAGEHFTAYNADGMTCAYASLESTLHMCYAFEMQAGHLCAEF